MPNLRTAQAINDRVGSPPVVQRGGLRARYAAVSFRRASVAAFAQTNEQRDRLLWAHQATCGGFLANISPRSLDRIRIELRIRRNDFDAFGHRLCDKEAIGWIAMLEGQVQQLCRMARTDVQDIEVIIHQCDVDEVSIGLVQLPFPKTNLDRHFPVRRWAKKNRVGRLADHCDRCVAQFHIAFDQPKQCVSVDQDFHCMYSAKSSRRQTTYAVN